MGTAVERKKFVGRSSIDAKGGLYSRGVPVLGGGIPSVKGNVYHVDSGHANASDSNEGTSPDRPLATLDAAIGKCTDSNGDLILVSEGHAETLAALITVDKIGVTIIGLGSGNLRPAFTVNAVIDGLSITAADVRAANIRFPTPSAAATALVNIAAARAKLYDVGFALGANVVDAVTITADGEQPEFYGCDVTVAADGPDSWLKFEGVIDRPIVEDCVVIASDGTNPFDDGVFDFNNAAVTNAIIRHNVFDGADQATTVAANIGALVGAAIGPNTYAGSATDADNVADTTVQEEAEDALEGENLDHLVAVTTAAADMTAEVVDGSVISRIVSKTSDTSSYSPTTDSLEMISDKVGAFSGDGGAAQDDSAKASLDLAHTDLDTIITDVKNLAAVAVANNADMTVEVIDGSVISNILSKTSDTSSYSPTTDSLEMASDKLGAFSGDGGAAQDDSVKASLDLAHTDIDAILLDTGTDGVVIGANAITADKIADNAFAAEHFALSAAEKTTDGIVVTRATGALPQTTALSLFTITGHVLLKRILGVVTVEIGAVGNVTHLRLNSTGAGATTDLCLAAGGLDVTGDVVDTMYEIDGTFGNAMIATTNLPKAKSQAVEIVLPPGSLEVACAGSDGGGGRVRWSVVYVPLEAGAQMVAA